MPRIPWKTISQKDKEEIIKGAVEGILELIKNQLPHEVRSPRYIVSSGGYVSLMWAVIDRNTEDPICRAHSRDDAELVCAALNAYRSN
jgi:hypothetical protein